MKNKNADGKEAIEAFYKVIGQNVATIRKEKGLSQLDLTHRMGFKSVSLVSQAEVFYNNQHFSLQHLYKIATILDCDVKEFFNGVDYRKIDWES